MRFNVIFKSQDLSGQLNRVMNIDLGLGNAQNERKSAPGNVDNFSKHNCQKIIIDFRTFKQSFYKNPKQKMTPSNIFKKMMFALYGTWGPLGVGKILVQVFDGNS